MKRRLIFSISTSFYKRDNWVEHVYESLKAQTYPWWEWVVTDDFSEEKCAEEKLLAIAKEDARVRYYKQSRKRELFYNPQYGCTGDIVMQLDCDDYIYPNILEQYNKYFTEDPELMGITCGHLIKQDLETFVSTSGYIMKDRWNINFAQMGRAWRNIIPHFDFNGDLKHYQNDTNLWRQVEARGRVLYLPRELYVYNLQRDGQSISKIKYSWETNQDLERERLFMENRFPMLETGEMCTFDLKYLSIDEITWAFYTCNFNTKTSPQDVLFLKTDIKPYEKQLVNELFYDHNIHYDVDKREKYDEIAVYLNEKTWKYLLENFQEIREKHKGTTFRFFMDLRETNLEDEQMNIFGHWSFWTSGFLYYGHLVL